jgi:PAT family beta-lactamase induction signal transducer AmpG
VVIGLLGFSSGLPLLLTGATLAIWMKEAGISNTAIGLFVLVGLPYNLKFLWAPVIDHLRLPYLTRRLGRRRSWTVLIQLCLMVSVLWLGSLDPVQEVGAMAVAALGVAFLSASQDIVIDAYRIESLTQREQGTGSAMTQVGYRFGLLAAGAGALHLAESIDWFWVYGTEALLVTVGLAAILSGPEPAANREREESHATVKAWLGAAMIAPFTDFTGRRGWVVILLFILLYKFGDAFAGAMANPFYVEMQFTKGEIANISKIFGMVATLLGVFLGGLMVYRLGILKSLLWAGILQMLSNLMFAVQAAAGHELGLLAVTIGIENLSGGMGSAAFVAYLSALCSVNHTATQYALLSSFMAVGRTVLSASSGWLADSVDWVSFFVVSTVVALPGLLLLVWMMRRFPEAGLRHDAP